MLAEQPKSQMEREVIELLPSDPHTRAYFINRVARPIANKM